VHQYIGSNLTTIPQNVKAKEVRIPRKKKKKKKKLAWKVENQSEK
jgi:hypothetical protein